jgi:hypothetical protein
LIPLELLYSSVLIILEDAATSPDSTDRLVKVWWPQHFKVLDGPVDLILPPLRVDLLSSVLSDCTQELFRDLIARLHQLVATNVGDFVCACVDSATNDGLDVAINYLLLELVPLLCNDLALLLMELLLEVGYPVNDSVLQQD